MKKTIRFAWSPIALAVAGALSQVAMAEDDLAEFTRPDSEFSVGMGRTNRDAPFFGQYSGLDQKGPQLTIGADWVERDDATGTWLEFHGRNTDIDNRDIQFLTQRQGAWRFSTEWTRMTVNNPFRVNTANTGIGTTEVVVPAAAIAPGTGNTIRLGTARETVSIGYNRSITKALEASLRVRNQEKTGTRFWASQGNNFVPEPVDFNMQELEGVMDYTTEAFQLSGGYLGSWFRNANKKVTITNGGVDEMALPPDNVAHQLFLSGGAAIAPRTRGTFKVSYTKGLQDDPFMAVTNAAGVVTNRTDLGGEVDTTLVQLGVASRPINDLSLRAAFRYEDRKDKTPVTTYIDDVVAPIAANTHDLNIPFSRTFTNYKLDGDFRLPMRLTAFAGIEFDQRERSYPPSVTFAQAPSGESARQVSFQPDTDETTVKLGLRRSLSETLNGSVSVLTSKREGDGYLPADDSANADVIDPIHWADRDRTKVRLALDWMPAEAVSLQLVAEDSSDEYDGRELGPRSGDASFLSLDASYAISDEWRLTGWVSHEEIEIDQSNCEGTCAALTWNVRTTNSTDAMGLGIEGQPTDSVKVGANLQYSHEKAEYRFAAITGALPGVVPPDYYYKTTSLKLFAEREHVKNSSIRVDFIYSRVKTDDWTWNGSGAGNQWVFNDDGSTVVHNPDEKVSFVGVSYRHRWQ
jgi:MtrB/PioB family decaheme-associated outer membrane protein